MVSLNLKQVQSKNFTIDSGDICLKIQRQKKCQLLDLSPNQLEGLIKININKLIPWGLDRHYWLIAQWPLNVEQLRFEEDNSDTKDNKRCLHHAMWAQESSKWSEAHRVIKCGSLSILTMDCINIWSKCTVYCHVQTWTITQVYLEINADRHLKIQIEQVWIQPFSLETSCKLILEYLNWTP